MPLERARQALDHHLRVARVHLTGGEPMQHPHWPQVAEMVRARGAQVVLTTNGLLVSRQLDDVVRWVDELRVSLDGIRPETYAAIRGVDGLERVLEGIRAASSRGVYVTTRTTIQRANFRELPYLVAVAKAAGVSAVSFQAVDIFAGPSFGRYEQPSTYADAALLPEEVDELAAIIREVDGANSPAELQGMVAYLRAVAGRGDFPPAQCNLPEVSVIVGSGGELRPCFFLPSWGGLEGPLPAALASPAAVELRRQFRAGERPECARCVCARTKGLSAGRQGVGQ